MIRGLVLDRFDRLSAWLVLLAGWQRYFVALAAGLFSSFAMAPFDVFPVLFLTLPIFVWLMDGAFSDERQGWFRTAFSSFLLGWWFGFGYFVTGLWWIANALLVEADTFAWALPLAVIALPALLAIFWGFAAVLARALWVENWSRVFTLALAFGLFEFLRGTLFTGFPWNTLGYAAMTMPLTMQSASLIGVYGVTVLAVIVFTAPLIALTSNSFEKGGRKGLLLVAAILAIAHVGFGATRLALNETTFVDDVKLRLVQPNIPQEDKLDPLKGNKTVQTYIEVSSAPGLDEVTHLLWPESAFPFLLTDRSDVLARIAALVPQGTQLFTGAARAEPSSGGDPYGRVYNSIYSINSNGEIVAAADKVHLVPFGEYLPFQTLLETFGLEQITRVHGGFEAGSSRGYLDGNAAGKILPLICYEIIFSGETLQTNQARPDWILNVTNDAWYGNTPGPYQHLRQSIIRGVETGLPMVRVANSGISAVTDPFGRTIRSLNLNEKNALDSQLPTTADATFFNIYKMLFLYVILATLFLVILAKKLIFRD